MYALYRMMSHLRRRRARLYRVAFAVCKTSPSAVGQSDTCILCVYSIALYRMYVLTPYVVAFAVRKTSPSTAGMGMYGASESRIYVFHRIKW